MADRFRRADRAVKRDLPLVGETLHTENGAGPRLSLAVIAGGSIGDAGVNKANGGVALQEKRLVGVLKLVDADIDAYVRTPRAGRPVHGFQIPRAVVPLSQVCEVGVVACGYEKIARPVRRARPVLEQGRARVVRQ